MRSKYTSLQILLHWLVFTLIVTAYCAMELKGFFPRSYRPVINAIHVTCGLGVLALMVVRLLVRIQYRAPAIVPRPHPAITGLSHLVHTFIYLLFIVLPILGFLTVYFKGHDWSVLGMPMPHAPRLDEDRQFEVKKLHELAANLGYFVIGIHAAAALIHHYVWRDNTLLRMLPGRKK